MLKKIVLISVIFFTFALSVFAESIKNYEVHIHLNKDASMDVVEEIDYDFGNNQRHGIFRFIPNSFDVKGQEKMWGLKERKLKFFNLEVYKDGKIENIAEIDKNKNGNFYLKIGDKYNTYSGLHKYKIKYKVQGSLRYFDNYGELYWNAIGLDWKVPIGQAKITVESDNIPFQNKYCYQGKLGSKEKCNIEEYSGKDIFETTRILNPHEGLSVALSFPKNSVQKVEIWGWSKQGWIAIIFGGILSLIGGIMIFIRKYLNKFKPDKPIIPIYRPYKNYHPALTGFLIDKKFDPQDITAGILSLAQKGIIEIERIEEKGILFGTNVDYIFRLKKEVGEVEDELDKMFIELIFSKSGSIDIIKIFQKLNEKISNEEVLNNENYNRLEKEIKLSDLKIKNQELYLQKQNIEEWIGDYSVNNNILQEFSNKNIRWWLVAVFILIYILMSTGQIKFGLVFFIMYILVFLFLGFLKFRYTKQGWEVKNNLDGFKMFLEMTEKERIKMFNAPELNPKQFFEYLPYAVAFGVEDKWKDQFKSITLPQPDWYLGPGPFMAGSMLSDISNISDSITSTMQASASGSSGGGFSGGGSGGGGGGSW